jgi:hypothetical protein
MSLSRNRYLDTPLLHQGFCLRLDFDGLGWLAAFDSHGGRTALMTFLSRLAVVFILRRCGSPLFNHVLATKPGIARFMNSSNNGTVKAMSP